MKATPFLAFLLTCLLLIECEKKREVPRKINVILDTDTNNELDDQHALAYLLFNQSTFNISGITINATSSGGNIDLQYEEARRILKLCNADTLPVLKGANQSFKIILPTMDSSTYDGKDAVDFIVKTAKQQDNGKLVLIAVGKLSNVALSLVKDPSIAEHIRLVWLGSNYPEPGEHNQNNDTIAMNYVLNSSIEFEIATVRYGKPSGTDAVKITKAEINRVMPGLGPHISNPVIGRHGGEFFCFGDYSVNLFEHIDYHSDPPTRSLFDMAAVAIVKNPGWAESRSIAAPIFIDGQWIDRSNNLRKITIWENFNKDAIINDFISSFPKRD